MPQVSQTDLTEIRRISRKKSVRKLAKAVKADLDKETLSRMVSGYLVLKANGHPDSDFGKYLATKERSKTFRFAFKAAGSVLPSLLTDGEFRSLVMNTRKNMKRKSEEEQEKQREPQLQVAKAPDNAAKVGPVDVTIKRDAMAQGAQPPPNNPEDDA